MLTFYKNKERKNIFEETGNTTNIYQNELNKDCFRHDMVYGAYTDLTRRTASGKVLCNKYLMLLIIHSMMDIVLGLYQWSTKCFDEISKDHSINTQKRELCLKINN